MASGFITNDRQAREAGAHLADIEQALSTERIFTSLADGLPRQAIDSYRRSLAAERSEVADKLLAYRSAREGQLGPLRAQAGRDLGAQLIVARIARGLTQKELARKLGLQEQAIQRYEAERYRSIGLAGFQRIAGVLDVRFHGEQLQGVGREWGRPFNVDHSKALKVLKHARARGWLKKDGSSIEDGIEELKRDIGEHVLRSGKPSLLRTGLGVDDLSNDLALLAWRAQVSRKAEKMQKALRGRFRLTDVGWLRCLVQSSADESALSQVPDVLSEHGILLIIEPTVPGMRVDGASFLLDETPVIGMTLLKDTLDNFWFTLLHELGHVVLHYRTGLQAGFFDDVDAAALDELEIEANDFARNSLIPEEIWNRSPAKIARTVEPVRALCSQLGVHPAIAFGRIRKERNDYSIFADKIGAGKVRAALQGAG